MSKSRGDDSKTNCAVEASLGVIGGRWKGVVLYWLLQGKHRFGELGRRVPNCSQRMLTLQLRELEADGLLRRAVFAEVPPRVENELTDFGRSLEPVVMALCAWGERYKERLAGVEGDERHTGVGEVGGRQGCSESHALATGSPEWSGDSGRPPVSTNGAARHQGLKDDDGGGAARPPAVEPRGSSHQRLLKRTPRVSAAVWSRR